MQIRKFAMLVVIAVCVGCGGESSRTVEQTPERTVPPPPAGPPASSPAVAPQTEGPGTADAAGANGVQGEPVKAGMGERSKRLEGGGYFSSTARAIPLAEETIQYAQARRSLDLYKAANEGRGPATHEEYMEKIIKENLIRLPELPAGHEYRYDPETEELLDVETGNP